MGKEQRKQLKKLDDHNEDEKWMGPWREVKSDENVPAEHTQTGTRLDQKLAPVRIVGNNKNQKGGD